mmetsp:Transcript_19234/g.24785  ORF Transcript_19234/g.24785 Transcript_19234/m.24785 type:complete len:349 (+) Transcript_19234:63-1109(+)
MGKYSQLSPLTARVPTPCPPSPTCLPRAALSNPVYTMDSAFTQEIMDKYDAFILDQFGVLHNGVSAMDGAVELVNHLANKEGKKLIVLSNTSAPAEKAKLKLPKLGFNKDDFCGMVTSGEEACRYIQNTYDKGTKCLMFTWDVTIPNSPRLTALPSAFLERCGLSVAKSVDEADFLLLHGSEVWFRGDEAGQVSLGNFINDGSLEENIDPILEECLARNLPCISANPDVIVQNPDGGFAYMPGKIGQRYEAMGGNVRIFGKPEPEHFKACLQTLGLPADRVCHVGDSLHHDIAGANMAGIANIFVTSGIHKKDLGTNFGELPAKDKVDDLIIKEGMIVPTHVIPAFRM